VRKAGELVARCLVGVGASYGEAGRAGSPRRRLEAAVVDRLVCVQGRDPARDE